jgi:multiple sugar transport system substrate-binding protein
MPITTPPKITAPFREEYPVIMKSKSARIVGALVLTSALVGALAACSSSSAPSSNAAPKGTYTFWDPYPQFNQTAAWTKLVEKCGTQAGVTVQRTGYDTTALSNKALLAGQQKASPDILLIDNPVVSTLASAGVLTDTAQTKLSTTGIEANILGAGQLNGKTYGVPIGANTLALYYNKTILDKAGVDPTTVTSWASLTAALAKVKAAGDMGITFSGINTEEGSFQFLPWFWGSGANLTKLDSANGVSALSLLTGWVKDGYAPNSVIQDTQTTSWQEFLAGKTAFSENGTWQLAGVKASGIDYGIISIPGKNSGSAPAPTGGEFLTIPVQKNTARYQVSEKIVSCLIGTDNSVTTDNTLSYIAPTTAAQAKQVATNASLVPWVAAVKAAKGRTSDNLGTKYPIISANMWTALQSALSGSATPAAAMKTAQAADAEVIN